MSFSSLEPELLPLAFTCFGTVLSSLAEIRLSKGREGRFLLWA